MIIEDQGAVGGIEVETALDDRPPGAGDWPVTAPATTCLPGHRGFRPGAGTNETEGTRH